MILAHKKRTVHPQGEKKKMSVLYMTEGQTKEIRKLVTEQPESTDSFMKLADKYSRTELAKTLKIPEGVLVANAQTQLYDVFWRASDHLVNDRFENKEGSCGRLIVGAKGIGKSTAARVFVALIEAIQPQVIALYVDFKRLSRSPLEKCSLLPMILDFLRKKRGIDVPPNDEFEEPVAPLFKILEEQKRYLFLIVDELDLLYKKNINELAHGHEILEDLVSFGTTRSGRMATFLCGSSAVLGDLIQGKAEIGVIRESFPLVVGAPNLNGSKYRTKRITPSLPTVDAFV